MKPPGCRAFLSSPPESSFAAGEILLVGNNSFLKANFCQGQGLSRGESHPGLAGLGFMSSRWLAFLGSCRCHAALRRLNLLLPLAGSLCLEHDGMQGLPLLQSQGIIAQK